MERPRGQNKHKEDVVLSTLHPHDHRSYAQNVREASERSADTSLFSGQALKTLVRHHFGKTTDKASLELAEGFASYISILPCQPVSFHNALDYSFLESISEATVNFEKSGHIVVLRGYPPAEFLQICGAKFGIDHEFFRRHTNYLETSDIHDHFVDPTLPSYGDDILDVRLTTIGSRRSSTHHGYNWRQVEKLRSSEATKMRTYLKDLSLRRGESWKPGKSIVRGYEVHDEDIFSLHQKATICMKTLPSANDRSHWLVLIWLDCGQDLGSSPRGPWFSRNAYPEPALIPVFRHTPETPLQRDPERVQEGFMLPQTAVNLYRQACSSLEKDLSIDDPFSAVVEILLYAAAAESQYLNMVRSNIHLNREKLFDASSDENIIVAARSSIVHTLDSLEEHRKDYEGILAFIQRRSQRHDAEPSATDPPRTLTQLVVDFENLINRSERLCRECERNMSMATSNASILEAKRGIEQSQSLFKFTVLASVYVPLSYTASFFGMNFQEIGQGKLSIWLYFVVSLPIFTLSLLTMFLNKKVIQHWFSGFSHDEAR